jgi:hypothetical protein
MIFSSVLSALAAGLPLMRMLIFVRGNWSGAVSAANPVRVCTIRSWHCPHSVPFAYIAFGVYFYPVT